MDMYKHYCELDWVRSDYFDGFIADRTFEILFGNDKQDEYWQFRIKNS